ncbi:hypothetical protein FOZ62_011859 [Perkinsus olseni]|uniref:E3 ubiquitin-protein ligase herc2 n=1 Tax=Perkinsus olseni TaxID=32597 RepID=A0A7J6PQW9_PEROL|nr:hypothetical protein FOZ62_011859 [Perkinsus olseni]
MANSQGKSGVGPLPSSPLVRALDALDRGEGLTVEDVVSCSKHSAALFEDVTSSLSLYTWGKTTNLALGYGQFSHSADQNRARQVVLPKEEVPSSVSCSAFHTVCVCESGHVAVWGFGQGYRLATGDDQSRVDPVLIDPGRFCGVPITKALASVDNSMFLDAEGHTYLVGSNKFGQCGRSLHLDVCKTPAIVKHFVSPCSDIAIGDKHCLAVDADTHLVWAWGDNSAGQLGVDFTQASVEPQIVSRLKGVGRVFANGTLSAALRGNGSELYVWGGGVCPLPTRVRVEATTEGKAGDDGWTVQAISGAVFVSIALPRGSNRIVLLSAVGDLYTVDLPTVKESKLQGGHSLVARCAHRFGADVTAHTACIFGDQCLVQMEDGRILASRLRDLTQWLDAGTEVGVGQAVAISGSPGHAVALVKANLPIIPRESPGRVPGLQALAQCQLARSSIGIGSALKAANELCVVDPLACGFVRFPLLVDYCLVTLLCNILLLYAKSPDVVGRLLKCLSPLLKRVVERRERGELSLFHRGPFERPADILGGLLSKEAVVEHMERHMAVSQGEEMAVEVAEEKPEENRRRTSSGVGGSLGSLEIRQQKRLDKVVKQQEVITEGVRRAPASGSHQWKEVQSTAHVKSPRAIHAVAPTALRTQVDPVVLSPRQRSVSDVSDSGPQPRTPTLGDFIFAGTRISQAQARSCPWASPPKQRSEKRLSEVIEEQRASSSSSSSSSSRPNDRCSWGMDVTPGVRRPSALAAVMEERAAQEAVRLVEEFERSEREARRLAALEEAAAVREQPHRPRPRHHQDQGGHRRHGKGKGKGRGKGRWSGNPLAATERV